MRKINNKPASIPFVDLLSFPKEKDGVIYVRQSSVVQMQRNIHSFEMQTDKFVEHFRKMGCTGNIEIVADDEAMSGTLDIHKRPGLTRVVTMITHEQVGWIGAVHVNRLTRDPWLITPSVLMKTCYDHQVWIATLRMNFNFEDEYCQRVFMLEAEESARHLKWMKLVLGGGKRVASGNGYYDGRPVAPGYSVDRTDPKRKKYIVYPPHALKTLWLYQRFYELDFNFDKLCREVAAMPYLYPKLEDDITLRLALKPIEDGSYKGCYKPVRGGLFSILTNPVYIGWWIPLEGEVIKNNHEAIIPEELFWMAYRRLSSYDLNGNRQNPERVVRFGKVEGLLKKVLQSDQGDMCYASHQTAHGNGYPSYRVGRRIEHLAIEDKFSIGVQLLDAEFLQVFFAHLKSWKGGEDWGEQLEQMRKDEENRKKQIQDQIDDAERKWQKAYTLLKDDRIEKTVRMQQALAAECAGLEAKIADLENDLGKPIDEDTEDIRTQYEIYTLLPDLLDLWDELAFETRLRFVNSLVRKVVINHVSPNWFKVEIHWKRSDWGIDVGHIRKFSYHESWKAEDDAIITALYRTADPMDLLEKMPDRSWEAIRHRALRLGVQRIRKIRGERGMSIYRHISLQDEVYGKEQGFDPTGKDAIWSAKDALKKDTSPT